MIIADWTWILQPTATSHSACAADVGVCNSLESWHRVRFFRLKPHHLFSKATIMFRPLWTKIRTQSPLCGGIPEGYFGEQRDRNRNAQRTCKVSLIAAQHHVYSTDTTAEVIGTKGVGDSCPQSWRAQSKHFPSIILHDRRRNRL